MDARRRCESGCHRILCLSTESVNVRNVEMHRVDDRRLVRRAGQQHGCPREPGDFAIGAVVETARRSTQGRDQVFRTPHECGDVLDRGEFRRGEYAGGRLAQRDDVEPFEGPEFRGAARLGQHHARVGGAAQRSEVGFEVRGREAVDAHDDSRGVERMRDECPTRRILAADRYGVLEIEDDRICAIQRLVVALRPICGAEQQGGAEVERHGRAPSHQTSAERPVVPTSTPSWFTAR